MLSLHQSGSDLTAAIQAIATQLSGVSAGILAIATAMTERNNLLQQELVVRKQEFDLQEREFELRNKDRSRSRERPQDRAESSHSTSTKDSTHQNDRSERRSSGDRDRDARRQDARDDYNRRPWKDNQGERGGRQQRNAHWKNRGNQY